MLKKYYCVCLNSWFFGRFMDRVEGEAVHKLAKKEHDKYFPNPKENYF